MLGILKEAMSENDDTNLQQIWESDHLTGNISRVYDFIWNHIQFSPFKLGHFLFFLMFEAEILSWVKVDSIVPWVLFAAQVAAACLEQCLCDFVKNDIIMMLLAIGHYAVNSLNQ